MIKTNTTMSIEKIKDNECLAYINDEFKLINCDYAILMEFLDVSQGKSLEYVIEHFNDRFSEEEIQSFYQVLLDEGVIDIKQEDAGAIEQTCDVNTSVIYSGSLYGLLRNKLKGVVEAIELTEFSNQKLNGDAILVVLESVTYGQFLELNKQLYAQDSPYLFVYAEGEDILCGPMVIPQKTQCFQCYLTHRATAVDLDLNTDESYQAISNIKVLNRKNYGEEHEDFFYYLSYVIQQELNKIIKKDGIYDLVGRQHVFRVDENNDQQKKMFVANSSCGCCHAFNKHHISFEEFGKKDLPSEIDESKGKVIKYNVGGLRSVSSQETKKLISNALDNSGLSIEIKQAEDYPLKDVIPVFHAELSASHHNSTSYLFSSEESHGKGITVEQAYFSCAFEIFERLSSRYFGEEEIVVAQYKKVQDVAIDLQSICDSIVLKDAGFDQLTSDMEIDWVAGHTVLDNKKVLIPASMVFMTPTRFKGTFLPNSSTGLAAGATLEDALLQGLYENIEHDAWMIGQGNPIKLPLVDIESSHNENLKAKVHQIKDMGYDVVVRDYTNDFNFPTFRAWIVFPENYRSYAFNGMGSAYDPEIALERSITEAVQSIKNEGFTKKTKYQKPGFQYMRNGTDSIYNLHYLIQKDIKVDANESFISLDKYTRPELPSVKDILKNTVESLTRLHPKIEVVYYDLTRNFFGVPVVKVMITSPTQVLGTPFVAVSPRMYTFQKSMGYSNREPSYEELYMGIYPH